MVEKGRCIHKALASISGTKKRRGGRKYRKKYCTAYRQSKAESILHALAAGCTGSKAGSAETIRVCGLKRGMGFAW